MLPSLRSNHSLLASTFAHTKPSSLTGNCPDTLHACVREESSHISNKNTNYSPHHHLSFNSSSIHFLCPAPLLSHPSVTIITRVDIQSPSTSAFQTTYLCSPQDSILLAIILGIILLQYTCTVKSNSTTRDAQVDYYAYITTHLDNMRRHPYFAYISTSTHAYLFLLRNPLVDLHYITTIPTNA